MQEGGKLQEGCDTGTTCMHGCRILNPKSSQPQNITALNPKHYRCTWRQPCKGDAAEVMGMPAV
eukprot:CAMPEP_0202904342 /NCGR_PEP_ID=MMETSP1392-20130828/28929_1 /ASSEMBLY_ACC=CAM_ASM_000868 /TAXON_ID=225041 /ORGANISM="Chlamydomonas chlamydogama, Strain SAG 11-48b" /LENGTH=63 /DNA_ID=CAMNT_0049591915 /DNA_START=302 /DNA_END=493 /DNA_ORIENTATION=+